MHCHVIEISICSRSFKVVHGQSCERRQLKVVYNDTMYLQCCNCGVLVHN